VELPLDYKPEFDSLRKLILEIAPERSVEHLLRKVVQCLAERPHAVMACLWLIDQGDLCASCLARPQCPDQRGDQSPPVRVKLVANDEKLGLTIFDFRS
jgi:hypothetical protein